VSDAVRELTADGEQASPILRFLSAREIPWRKSVRTLIDQYGIENDPWYGWKIIPIRSGTPLLEGLMVPLAANFDVNLNAGYPPIYLQCHLHVSDDAEENFRDATRQLEAALGPGQNSSLSNTHAMRWDDGYARIDATIWPAHLRASKMSNPAHAQHPFLASACHVGVSLKYLTPMSAAETAWAGSFAKLRDVSEDVSLTYPFWDGAQYTREFLRKRGAATDGGRALGVSADGAALIAADTETLSLYPLARVHGSALRSVPDERDGPTTHHLTVQVPKDFTADGACRDVEIARQVGESGEIEELAALVKSRTG
jgi:hypothetical protein